MKKPCALGQPHWRSYGTFTSTKERVVEPRRKLSDSMARACAEHPDPPAAATVASGDLDKCATPIVSDKKRRK